MKMHQSGNESSASSQSVPKIEEELPSVSARVQKLHDQDKLLTPKGSSAESERKLDLNVSADMHNSHSMIFEERKGLALSEHHHNHLGALSMQEKASV